MTTFIVYGLETHNTDRAKLYYLLFYRLSKVVGKHNCDLTPYEIEKCKKDILAFEGDDCVSRASDFLLKIKGEERKMRNKIVEYNLQLRAVNGSGLSFSIW